MTLQKCLQEEVDITELLAEWNLSEKDGELFFYNPPPLHVPKATDKNEKRVFETE